MTNNTVSSEFLHQLSQVVAAKHLTAMRRRSLFVAGAYAHNIYVVLSGAIKVERSLNDHRSCIIRFAGPGNLVGEEALSGEPLYITNATAIMDTEVLSVPTPAFIEMCDLNPQHWRTVLTWILKERDVLEDKLNRLDSQPIRERILHLLPLLTEMVGTKDAEGSTLCVTQAELASYLGATRETTSTVLNQLVRDGILRVSHRSIRLLPQRASTAVAPVTYDDGKSHRGF